MKIAITLSLIGLIASVLLPSQVTAYSFSLEYGWTPQDMTCAKAGAFDILGVTGSQFDGSSLTTVCDLRVLPQDYEMTSYELLWEEWEPVGGSYSLATASPEGLVSMAGNEAGGLTFLESGRFLGYSVCMVVVKPWRVIDGSVSILSSIGLRVDCEPGPEGVLRVKRRSPVMDRYARGALEKMIGGPIVDAGDWLVEEPGDWIETGPSLDGGTVDCIVVTPDSMMSEFERLADFHDRIGVRTVVRSVEWVRAHYGGADGPERIRNFIRDAYQNWGTVYVLLGGDPGLVPMRILDYPEMMVRLGRSEMPTDVYYTNLDGDWNGDGDDRMGEFGLGTSDGLDFFPDVFVGRAAAADQAEAKVFVDKTIAYMRGSHPGIWQRTTVFMAQQLFDNHDGAKDAEEVLAHFPEHFERVKLYENYDQYPGSFEESLDNVLTYLQAGCGIVGHIGHGDEFRLDLGSEYMERWHVESIENDTAYFFMYMMNCSSADPRVESSAKAFVKNQDGGAFAVMGNSSLAYPDLGIPMEEEFFSLVFSDEPATIGAASALCRQLLLYGADMQKWWMYLNYVLLGDPVINLWVNEPVDLAITKPPQLALSDSTLTVEVADGGVGVEGAVVVLRGDRGEYGVGVSDGSGFATVNYRPLGLGWSDVVVWAEGYRLYEDSVEVVGSGGRLYVSSVSIDDGSGWVGNDDGEVGWGERVGLGVGLVNGGSGSVSGVSCTLRVVTGCSLYVRVRIDSMESDTLVYLGLEGAHPGSMPFGVVAGESVLGRGVGSVGEDLGCWLWLDGMGWHLRMIGDGDSHSYVCSVGVYGELLGGSGYGLGVGDSLREISGGYEFIGSLGSSDYEDGMDLLLGDSDGIVVHDGTEGYGTVGSSEVVGWYDVEFDGMRFGDQLGIWFEALLEDGVGGSWRDWFKVLVRDGAVLIELVDYAALGGDTLGVWYGLRNVGGGGLRGIEGRLRGLSGVEVYDSVSVYGEISSGGYSEGDGYKVRELGGPVSYEVYVVDTNGRSWTDTVDVRGVLGVSGLNYEAGSAEVSLRWVLSGDSLLYGYDIYRSDESGGVYSRVGYVDGYSWYVDEGLQSEEDYYYYICARDGMGNVSAPSETLEAWTGPPYLTGWPTELRGNAPSSPVVGDASHDGRKEIFVGTKGLEIAALDNGGRPLSGYPHVGSCEIWSSPVLVDLDGDGTLECVFGEGSSPSGDCARIVALNHDGSLVSPANNWLLPGDAPGWPQEVLKQVRSAPTVHDLDSDGRPEILVGAEKKSDGSGPFYVFRYDGSPYLDGSPIFARTAGGIWATPCVFDLDGDKSPEIVLADLTGCLYIWRANGSAYLADTTGLVYNTGAAIMASPVVGDIDHDEMAEIVVVNVWGQVFAWNHDGTPVAGPTPMIASFAAYTRASPALADFDDNDELEIVIGLGQTDLGYLALLRWDGSPYGDDEIILTLDRGLGFSSPAVGDVDDDGELEIVTCTENGLVMALNPDGTPLGGYPIRLDGYAYSSPLIDDIDSDGDMDLVVAAYDSRMHVWDLSSPYSAEKVPWGMFQHDRWNSGVYGFETPTDTLSPTYAIAVFQNPVTKRVMDIFVLPSEHIQDVPLITIERAGSADTLDVDVISSQLEIYRGHHIAQPGASEIIYVKAMDMYGNESMDSRAITYSHLAGGSMVVTSEDGILTAEMDAESGASALAILPVDTDYLAASGVVGERLDLGTASYNVCVIGDGDSDLRLRVLAGSDSERLLYRYDGGWVAVDGQRREGASILADADPGIFALGTGQPMPPQALSISQVSPNPFRDRCSVVLNTPGLVTVKIAVFDVRGRLVKHIYGGTSSGALSVFWDGTGDGGRRVSSGIYFLRAEAGSAAATRKVLLVR